jgi:HK97 family phage prohead protease
LDKPGDKMFKFNKDNDDFLRKDLDISTKDFSFELTSVTKSRSDSDDDEEIGVFYGAMATEDVDSSGDIIDPNAFDNSLKKYKKTKKSIPLFFGHNWYDKPIGIIPIDSVEKDGKRWNVKGILNLNTQEGREVYSLMKQGALCAMSIGFYIIDYENRKNGGLYIKELELMEVSVVTWPANSKATVTQIKALEKGATIYHDLPLASEDREWDSDAAIARVRRATDSEDQASKLYRNAFFWFDEENWENLTAYKLPFVDVINGKLTAVPRGIFASAAAMSGARGGVDIPEADRSKVISHIEKYYKKMDRDSPFKDEKSINIEEFTCMKEVECFLKEQANLSSNQRKILISKIKSFSRDVENEQPAERDVEQQVIAKIEQYEIDKRLNQLNNLLKGE